jgi:cobalt-zinc-cadmium efflux system outer membrane protein
MPIRSAFSLAVFLAALLTLDGSALAEETALDTYVAEVLARSPSLRARTLRSDASRREASAAGIYPDPTLNVMVDNVPDVAEMPMVRYQLGQMFMWPGKLRLMETAALRTADAAGADVDTSRLQLRLEAKRGFFMLILNARRREINKAARGLAATVANAALGRFGAGMAEHHEVARAQVEVSALDIELVNLEGERRAMVAMLNALRNKPTDTDIVDPGEPPSSTPTHRDPLATLVDRALANRPEIRAMGAMREEARAMASLARLEPAPDFMVGVWVNQNMGAPVTFGAMVGTTVPIFNVTRQSRRASAFDARAGSAAAEQDAMRAMIQAQVAEALARLEAAERQVDLIRDIVLPKARESFESTLASFGAGRADLNTVLDARRALQRTQLAAVEAQVMRAIAAAELERAIGAPVTEGNKL